MTSIFERMTGQTVALLGDFAVDEYLLCKTSRISREAPVLVLDFEERMLLAGCAANVLANLVALQASVIPFGVVGNDDEGQFVLDFIKRQGQTTEGLLQVPGYTSRKTRVMGGALYSPRQQIARIDYKHSRTVPREQRTAMKNHFFETCTEVDAVIVADFGLGLFDAGMIELVSQIKDITSAPVFIDSRYQLGRFRGATVITPNVSEAENITDLDTSSSDQLIECCTRLHRATGAPNVVLKRGKMGMVASCQGSARIIPAATKTTVDPTGAGDTALAALALAYAAGAELGEASEIANMAAGISVMKETSATVSIEELMNFRKDMTVD